MRNLLKDRASQKDQYVTEIAERDSWEEHLACEVFHTHTSVCICSVEVGVRVRACRRAYVVESRRGH